MSKQFIVITKDGSKWLRLINPHPEKLSTHWAAIDEQYYNPEWQEFEKNNFDLPYIGSRPDGTTVDESDVKLIRQYQDVDTGQWFDIKDEAPDLVNDLVRVYREAYTDVKSHDRHISDNPRYPLFAHMSDEHGLTLLDSELDEIASHASPMTGAEYWKRRCEAAEQLVGIGFLHVEFMNLLDRCGKRDKYNEWEQIIEEGRAYVS